MRKFEGTVSTDRVGSECDFEFEVEDDATEEEIELAAKEAAFNWVEWGYHEVDN